VPSSEVKLGGYLAALNPEQRGAVEHFEGPLLVLAGAGSGKTRVLTSRIAHLVEHHGVDPSAILAVTFTNKAAGEMKSRVHGLLGTEPAGMWIGTFHSIGARILRRYATRVGFGQDFTILDADDSLRAIRHVMEDRNVPKRWRPQGVHEAISTAKNLLITPEVFATTCRQRIRLRRPPRQTGRVVRVGTGRAGQVPRPLLLRSRRRVPGH
jgi:DNA helicase-2/ATP-dependent DNA helicase PcrA